jgi:hypothetical protein
VLAATNDYNNQQADLAAAVSQSVSSDGQTPMTGNLQMGNNKITGAAPGTTATDVATVSQVSEVKGYVVGSSRNLFASIPAANVSATITADEVVLETTLGGLAYKIVNFNKTVNLSTVGVGGMDIGTAPVSGYVAVYAIYNPTTLTSALLAANATAAVAPEIYGGANMPAGYTASALVGVMPTNASSQFKAQMLEGRNVSFMPVPIGLVNTAGVYTSLSISTAVPRNAKRIISGELQSASASITNGTVALYVAANAIEFGRQVCAFNWAGASSSMFTQSNYTFPILTTQVLFYASNASGAGPGTPTFSLWVGSYAF